MDTQAPWMVPAEKLIGLQEVPGKKHNPVIVGMFARAGFAGVKDDETAWCAAFVISQLLDAGYRIPPGVNLAARSLMKLPELSAPIYGCVVVLWRESPTSWKGHTGFYVGAGSDGKSVRVLGGNQSNSVSIETYPTSQVLGYYWPERAKVSPPSTNPAKLVGETLSNALFNAAVKEIRKPGNPIPSEDATSVAAKLVNAIGADPEVASATNMEKERKSLVSLGSLGTIAIAIASIFGLAISPDDIEKVVAGVGAAASIGTALLALYGRWRSRKPIGIK